MQPTSHVHVGPPDIPADAAFTHIHTEEAMADVTIDPGRAGQVNATIRVLREDLTQYPAKAVTLALDPPGSNLHPIARVAAHLPDGSWQVDAIELSQGGDLDRARYYHRRARRTDRARCTHRDRSLKARKFT